MRSALFFCALLLAGCGSSTQRAALSPAPPAGPSLLDASPTEREYIVDTSRSKLEVWGTDITGGQHRITFGRWRARVLTVPVPTIAAELEMMTARLHPGRGTATLRYKLLEAQKYPHSTLEATMRKTGAGGEHVVEGVTELHGVRKRLRFTGRLVQDGETFHFTASFVISRKSFGIRYAPAEPFLNDDVRIVIDVIAVPASKPPPQPVGEEPMPDEPPPPQPSE